MNVLVADFIVNVANVILTRLEQSVWGYFIDFVVTTLPGISVHNGSLGLSKLLLTIA